MTDKVLPSSSREALAFLTAHWRSLAKMSVVPLLAYLMLAFWQLRFLAGFYREMAEMMSGGNIDPAFMSSYMRNMGLMSIASLVGFGLLGTLFVQVVRFHRTGADPWLLTDKAGLKATAMTLVYGLGIMMLSLVVYFGAALVFALVMAVFGTILGALFGGVGAALVGVIAFAGVIALVAGLYWFMFRFLVGLPGVALGHSPDFFRDMWPLSKGESWGLPLRVMAATLIAYIPLILVSFVFFGGLLQEFFTNAGLGSDNPAVMFPLMADLMERMAPFTVVSMILFTPFMWFSILLLAIAFQRFRGRAT